MEKSRAIEKLNDLRCHVKETSTEEEALVMAIDALKAQHSQKDTTKDATSDLISRQEAIDALVNTVSEIGLHDNSEVARYGATFRQHEIIDIIKGMPPAQPEPQEGHWIWVAGDLECSKCHTRYPDLYPDYDNAVACPHCGAKMTISK